MQAVVEKIELNNNNNILELGLAESLIKELETADNNRKNVIENKLVSLKEKAISELIFGLANGKGVVRAVCAMALIRIGKAAIKPLKESLVFSERWIAEYIVREIEGSKISIAS